MVPGSDKVIPLVNFLPAILKKVAKESLTAAKSLPFLLKTRVLAGAVLFARSSGLNGNKRSPAVEYSRIDWSPLAARTLPSPVKATAVMILAYGPKTLPDSGTPDCTLISFVTELARHCTLISFVTELARQREPSAVPAATSPTELIANERMRCFTPSRVFASCSLVSPSFSWKTLIAHLSSSEQYEIATYM